MFFSASATPASSSMQSRTIHFFIDASKSVHDCCLDCRPRVRAAQYGLRAGEPAEIRYELYELRFRGIHRGPHHRPPTFHPSSSDITQRLEPTRTSSFTPPPPPPH